MDNERLALLALHKIPGVGSYTIRQLISYCGSAVKAFHYPTHKLLKIPGIGPGIAESIHPEKYLQQAEDELRYVEDHQVQLLFHMDEDYPHRLRQIPDAPSLLYQSGSGAVNNAKVIAIVGTRKATSYGLGITKELIEGLAHHRPLIVSGLAYGIDAQAHRTALSSGLETAAVMAGGINYIYPAIHRALSKDIIRGGCLLTENGVDTVPDATRFPARNRIIAGMSDVILVIEAAERGGALITAAIANDYDREVMAVPGNIERPFSRGCNQLIRRHRAHLLSKPEDVEYLLNWDISQKPRVPMPEVSAEEASIIDIFKNKPIPLHLDKVSWATGYTIGQTASLLLQLEFKGIIKALPGKLFQLKLFYE
jgi:DNA processing protein